MGDQKNDNSLLTTNEDKEKNLRNKTLLIALGVLGALVLLAFVWNTISIFGSKTSTVQRKSSSAYKESVENQIIDKESLTKDWKTAYEEKLKKMEDKYEKRIGELDERLQEAEKKKKNDEKNNKRTPQKEYPAVPLTQGVSQKESQSQTGVMPFPVTSQIQDQQKNKQEPGPQSKTTEPSLNIIKFEFEAKPTSAGRDESKDIFIPMGLTTGITLTGADTPTFQMGQQDPQPILVSISTEELTAADKTVDLKGCLVLASAHGSVSSERAMPRAVKMECRDKKGDLYSGDVDGWVLGDDGKIGMKGRLVSRWGTVLGKAFVAEVIEGVGSVLSAQSRTLSTSPLGSTQTIDPDKALQAGLGQGVGQGSERLAQFYIKIAEQIYPVVEVLPARKVTVLFTGGLRLVKVDKDKVGGNTNKLPGPVNLSQQEANKS